MLALSIADVRDYVIIIFAGSGALAFLFMTLVTFLLFRKFGGVLDGLRSNLESAKTTLGNAAVTSSLITDIVAKPLIKVSSFAAGAKRGVIFVMKLASRGGGS